jgi:hypothetical protein
MLLNHIKNWVKTKMNGIKIMANRKVLFKGEFKINRENISTS